jgi:ATP-dependent DNA helicase Rep
MPSLPSDLVSDLNPSQRAAVEHGEGPLLVLAGAGSGKTRVVTRRIARLVAQGTPAWSIVAVTFTNKAAAEMRERVASLTGPKVAKEIRVTTFHSFGLDVLGKEAKTIGFRNGQFAVFDQADCMGVVRELLRNVDAGKRFDVASILGRISVAKNAFQTADTWEPREGDEYDEIARELYPRYTAALRGYQAFDFDDLVTETVLLLKKREDVRARWQSKIRYLLVDEYQDTNASQLELVRLLAGTHHNVTVVGDDDQAIYAWRGADVTNILDFEQHFTGAKVVKLEENYRSIGAVLDVANAILAKSQGKRHGKVLRATRDKGPKADLVVFPDPEVEAAWIADEIHRVTKVEGTLRPRDVAILYRSNAQSDPLELALKERGISHVQIGGQKFYERKEVKDLLAYLRVALAPNDEMSLRRVINYPSRGIGDVALTKLSMFATARDLSLFQAVERAQAIEDLPGAAIEGCAAFEAIVGETRRLLEAGTPTNEVARQLAEKIDLKSDLMAASPGEAFARRWGNVEAVCNVLRKRDERGPADLKSIAEYLRLLTLHTDTEEAQHDSVTLSTMHGAKGLEFSLVFVAGIEEGFLPHSRTTDPKVNAIVPQDIEEERRLFYVAVTRARDRLVLSRCKFRAMRGKPVPRTPSRFLLDVPDDLYVMKEVVKKPGPSSTELADGASALLAALSGGSTAPSRRPTFRR